jgi:hypothetical protein
LKEKIAQRISVETRGNTMRAALENELRQTEMSGQLSMQRDTLDWREQTHLDSTTR